VFALQASPMWTHTEELLNNMIKQGYTPNSASYAILLNGMAKPAFARAMGVLRMLLARHEPYVTTDMLVPLIREATFQNKHYDLKELWEVAQANQKHVRVDLKLLQQKAGEFQYMKRQQQWNSIQQERQHEQQQLQHQLANSIVQSINWEE
jgi:hypothetical protein